VAATPKVRTSDQPENLSRDFSKLEIMKVEEPFKQRALKMIARLTRFINSYDDVRERALALPEMFQEQAKTKLDEVYAALSNDAEKTIKAVTGVDVNGYSELPKQDG
jgi:hypothetical protein